MGWLSRSAPHSRRGGEGSVSMASDGCGRVCVGSRVGIGVTPGGADVLRGLPVPHSKRSWGAHRAGN